MRGLWETILEILTWYAAIGLTLIVVAAAFLLVFFVGQWIVSRPRL